MALAQTDSKLPDGAGRVLIERSCTKCHSLDRIQRARNTVTGWAALVDEMVSKGAQATSGEMQAIISYLGANFGKDNAPAAESITASGAKINVNKVTASELSVALGIPKETAFAIVWRRAENGPYKRWEELGSVPGLDLKQIEPHRDRILF